MTEFDYREVLLSAKNISLDLGGNLILRDINLEIKNIHRDGLTQGQVVSLLAPSGRGKTQLFRILSGLNPPTTGEVLIANRQGQLGPVHSGLVGVLQQSYPLFEHRTVWGNLIQAGRIAGMTSDACESRARNLLERFQMFDKADFYAAQISGGQRQRVAIAQQLMRSPMFLLMDEPYSGLDPVMKDRACELISEIAATDELMTIVVITHDIGSAVQVADHIWLLGRDTNLDGSPVPGSYIKETFDLAAAGMAWRPGISATAEFAEWVRLLRSKFNGL